MTPEEIEQMARDGIPHCDHAEASVEASGQITPMPTGFSLVPYCFPYRAVLLVAVGSRTCDKGGAEKSENLTFGSGISISPLKNPARSNPHLSLWGRGIRARK
jgi:hypothetical protein